MGYIGEDGGRPRSGSSPHSPTSKSSHQPAAGSSSAGARSPSPSGTASTNNNNSSNNNGTIPRRRDRVSVGSRITKTIIVRPPYAARDELDFERRPRSNTIGTVASSEANEKAGRGGRHAGIQPPMHDTAAARSTSPSSTTAGKQQNDQLSSLSGTTTTQTPADEKEKGASTTNAIAGAVPSSISGAGARGLGNEFNEKMIGKESGGDSSNPLPSQDDPTSRPSMSQRFPSNDASRWLAFTLPMKYRKMLDDYMTRPPSHDGVSNNQQQSSAGPVASSSSNRPSRRRRSTEWRHRDADHADDEDQSDIDSDQSSGDYHYRYFGRRKKQPKKDRDVQSRQDTGERGGGGGGGSEDNHAAEEDSDNNGRRPSFLGRSRRSHRDKESRDNSRRSSRARGHYGSGGTGDIADAEEGLGMAHEPITGGSRRNSLHSNAGWTSPWLPNAGADPENCLPGQENGNDANGKNGNKRVRRMKTKAQTFQTWVVRSAFAPLFFRTLNLAFTASLLGVAISIHNISNDYNVSGVLGSSTTFAIIVAPLSLLHIITNVYAEYFGSPIGVWKVRSKMFYTFVELIFICLWSGLLSLAFDDLFTSPAGCTAYTPNAQYRQRPIGSSESDGTLAAKLCSRQSALVALVFFGLILYVLVLIVSLFRIFAKISRIQ